MGSISTQLLSSWTKHIGKEIPPCLSNARVTLFHFDLTELGCMAVVNKPLPDYTLAS